MEHKPTPDEVRLRLVEAAVAAGRKVPQEIMAWCRMLEGYVRNVPYEVIVTEAVNRNIQEVREIEKPETPGPLHTQGPRRPPVPLDTGKHQDGDLDTQLRKIMEFSRKEEEQPPPPPEEEDIEESDREEEREEEEPGTATEPDTKTNPRLSDDAIRRLVFRKVPLGAMADFFNVTPQTLKHRLKMLDLEAVSGPRGPTGAQFRKDWVSRLRQEEATKGRA